MLTFDMLYNGTLATVPTSSSRHLAHHRGRHVQTYHPQPGSTDSLGK